MASTQSLPDAAQIFPDFGAILDAFWTRAWEGATSGITNIPKVSFGVQGGWAGMVMVGVGLLLVLGALAFILVEETAKSSEIGKAILAVGKLAEKGD